MDGLGMDNIIKILEDLTEKLKTREANIHNIEISYGGVDSSIDELRIEFYKAND